MKPSIPESHPLHRLFRGLTETTFLSELGIGDPRLVGYVAELLARFVPSEAAFPLRQGNGRAVTQVSALAREAEATADERIRGERHQQVGDFTLFWTGVYPEAVPVMGELHNARDLVTWQQQGKRAYYLASSYRDDDQAPVLRRLSDEFELCAYGLSRVRKEWESMPGRDAHGLESAW